MSGIILPAVGSVINHAPLGNKRGLASASRPRKAHHSRLKIEIITAVLSAVVLVAAQVAFHFAFADRFLPGTVAGGQEIGGMRRPEAEKVLKAQIAATHVSFSVGSKAYKLKPEEVGVRYDVAATLDHAFTSHRNSVVSILTLWPRHTSVVGLSYVVDRPTEQAYVAKVVADTSVAPVDATFVVQDGQLVVQPDKKGQGVTPNQVKAVLDDQISDTHLISNRLKPTVTTAKIVTIQATAASTHVKELITTPITITYAGKTFSPTPTEVGGWLAFDAITPKVNPDAVRAYLSGIAKQTDVPATVRKVNIADGVSREIQAGANGSALDQDALLAKLSSAVSAAAPLTLAAPMRPVPFQTQYNQTLNYPKYIEVNLSKQHLWVYQEGVAIYDSPITSGATGAGFPTVTGTFAVQAKQTSRHLVGYQYGPRYNYDVFVQYWMPFYEGYGLHDASWRNGNFGGSDYYYGGSHGCVNLPLATAAYLYKWADVGTPVWVHN